MQNLTNITLSELIDEVIEHRYIEFDSWIETQGEIDMLEKRVTKLEEISNGITNDKTKFITQKICRNSSPWM